MSIKKCGLACQWLGNVDMYMYAIKNIPCGSRVMNISTNWKRTGGRTDSQSDYSSDPRAVQLWLIAIVSSLTAQRWFMLNTQ